MRGFARAALLAGISFGAACRTYHRWDFRIQREKPSLIWVDVTAENPVQVGEVLLSWWPDARRSVRVAADPAGRIVLDDSSLSALILLGLREDVVPRDFYVLDDGNSWAGCAFPVERQVFVLKSLREAEPERYHALVSQAGPPGKEWATLLAEIAR
jgi:hypothetical protein